MRRVCATGVVVGLCLAPLAADVRITQTMSMEGPMAAAAAGQMATMHIGIKGKKSRSDVELPNNMTISTIVDLEAKEIIVLNSAEKTAQVTSLTAPAPGEKPPVSLPKIEGDFAPTGEKRTVEGTTCDDHKFGITMSMAELGQGGQVAPEAAAMMKDVTLVADGVICVAKEGPGVAEFTAFQKAALDANLLGAMMGGGATPSGGGMDKLMKAAASAPGIPYVTEISLTFEGTGPMVEMMKSMGPMKMVQKTTKVSTEALSDDLFKIPEGYKVEKK